MPQLSANLLDPDIDLTTEESQWEHVELIYRAMAYDEFQFTDRGRFFAVRWLLENRKWPEWENSLMVHNDRWHWYEMDEIDEIPEHAKIFPENYWSKTEDVVPYRGFMDAHNAFGDSILWFCSLWPRFYVECVLPTQEGEPANAEEFWENLCLSVPGEDWRKLVRIKQNPHGDWDLDISLFQSDEADLRYHHIWAKAHADPHYRWSFGNAVIRAVKAWRGI